MHPMSRPLSHTALVLLAAASLWLPARPGAAAPSASANPAASNAPAPQVDINAADAETLMGVPGIGKSLAQRIVDFRQRNGAFAKIDDLLKVQGIGEKSLERLRPYLTVGKAK